MRFHIILYIFLFYICLKCSFKYRALNLKYVLKNVPSVIILPFCVLKRKNCVHQKELLIYITEDTS